MTGFEGAGLVNTKPEIKHRKLQPDNPFHKPRTSLLSEDCDKFSGLLNWGIFVLTIGGLWLLLQNLIKSGIPIAPVQWCLTVKSVIENSPSAILLFSLLVPVFICLLIERGLSMAIIPERLSISIHIINIFVLMLLPVVAIHVGWETFSFIGLTTVCLLNAILFLKLWSYVHVNYWCRQANRTVPPASSGKKTEDNNNELFVEKEHHSKLIQYPENLTINDLFYFLFAPTLCYELNFPRTSRIRKQFLLDRMLEILIGMNILHGLYQQNMIPHVKYSLEPFSKMNIVRVILEFLQFSFFNSFLCLFIFYVNFHSLLNFIGELLQFADRHFYKDWWNANNIEIFWRKWNQPVHRWCVRHVYIPLLEMGFSKTTATIFVFFISGLFHEYVVSIPFRTVNIWIFTFMMIQIPLMPISKYLEKIYGPIWSNMSVWCCLVLYTAAGTILHCHNNADTINLLQTE